MEEVDKILIHTLKQVGCEIEDDVTSVRHFTTELVVEGVVRCLRLIRPEIEVHHTLPPSMSARFRVGATLAQICQDVGYKSEIGYQTFLYSSETDVRNILLFLIDRLPKEHDKTVGEPLSRSAQIRRAVSLALNRSLSAIWVPSYCLDNGLRYFKDGEFYLQNYEKTHSFTTVPLVFAKPPHSTSEAENVPLIREQCSVQSEVLPSVIEANTLRLARQNLKALSQKQRNLPAKIAEQEARIKNLSEVVHRELATCESAAVVSTEKESTIEESPGRLRVAEKLFSTKGKPSPPVPTPRQSILHGKKEKEEIINVETIVSTLGNNLQQLETDIQKTDSVVSNLKVQVESAESQLQEDEHSFLLKKKTYDLLPDAEENISKLQNMVEQMTQKLSSLASQWENHRAPLVEKYRDLKETRSSKVGDAERELAELVHLQEKVEKVSEDIQEKDAQYRQLTVEMSKSTEKNISRTAHTQRIFEFVGNIKKQQEDINKVLEDTRDVQKEINQLSGKLERTFTVIDEVIFRDARRDETARRAYKLLATLHEDCSLLIKTVEDTGTILREIRDLDDQIETEKNKNVAANLERIEMDLKQIKLENHSLIGQLRKHDS